MIIVICTGFCGKAFFRVEIYSGRETWQNDVTDGGKCDFCVLTSSFEFGLGLMRISYRKRFGAVSVFEFGQGIE